MRSYVLLMLSLGLAIGLTGCGDSQSSKSEVNKSTPASTTTAEKPQTKNIASDTAKPNTDNLTPQDITNFENGVGLQAEHVMNVAVNGINDFGDKYAKDELTIDQIHTKSNIVINLEHNMYDLFKSQKTVSGLQPLADQYDQIFKQVIPIVDLLSSVSISELDSFKKQINEFSQKKKDIDNQFSQIKAEVMKEAGADASKAINASDADLKPGPSKVATAGGLGDTFETIKAAFGDPNRVNKQMTQGGGMYSFQNDKIMADFIESRAFHVTYQLDNNPLTMDQAKELAKKLMPHDAKFIKTYTKDNQKFDVYESKALIPLFDSDWFENTVGDVQPGYFDIAYLIDGDKIRAVDSFVSDNP